MSIHPWAPRPRASRCLLQFEHARWSLSCTQLTCVSKGVANGMYKKQRSLLRKTFCHVGPSCTSDAVRWFVAVPRPADSRRRYCIFLRKTATSLFEHTSHIHRSNRRKNTHTHCIKHKNWILCLLFWCLVWLWSCVLTRHTLISNKTEDVLVLLVTTHQQKWQNKFD